jgi:hypothetical protein
MTVQQLRPPVIAGHVAAARAELEAAQAVPTGSLSDAELGELLSEVAVLEAQAAALRHVVLAEADARKVAERSGATGTDAWAARLTGTTRGVMSGGIWLARLLTETYHATRQAFASGAINEAQMRVIVRAAHTIPAQVSAADRAAAEAALVAKAVDGMNPRRLRQAGRRMLEVISRDLADRHQADQHEQEERRAAAETWLTLHDNGDGTYAGGFVISELHGHLLRAALERLSAPRRLGRNRAGKPVVDPTLPGGGMNWSERLGAAFCELLEHLPTTGHGPVGATVQVTIDYQHLLDGLAGARLDTGATISAGAARRLACGAGILPAVLGGKSEPLDLARTRRLHSKPQRAALSLTYDTCATEGCERPFVWCEIHHPHAWAKGGHTSLENGIPLCGWHHQRAHDDTFTLRRLPSGEVRFRRRT